jgi:hypothetical protein
MDHAIMGLTSKEHAMTNEDQLIELCDHMKIALDINYLRGTVTVGRKKFTSLSDALVYARGRMDQLKNFG